MNLRVLSAASTSCSRNPSLVKMRWTLNPDGCVGSIEEAKVEEVNKIAGVEVVVYHTVLTIK